MTQVLSEEWQRHIASSVAHWAEMAKAVIEQAATAYERPSVLYRPKVYIDGDSWCALYGENLQDGVAGFGSSPEDAIWDFDRNWRAKLPETKTQEKNMPDFVVDHVGSSYGNGMKHTTVLVGHSKDYRSLVKGTALYVRK